MTVDPMCLGSDEPHPVADRFITELQSMTKPRVLELGTRRWSPDLITHHRHWAPTDASYVMADIQDGDDVDIVMDAHDLNWLDDGGTDAFIAISTWEHLRLPWVAAQEVARVLSPGGLFYCQTHMAFPWHGWPNDYTRWTSDGLSAMFEWAGLTVLDASHTHPAKVVPLMPPTRWNTADDVQAWLCVDLFARKP